MDKTLKKELTGYPFNPPSAERIVTEEDLSGLPEPAQRYLRFTGVIGRPLTWSMRLSFSGTFRFAPDQEGRPCQTIQYNTMYPVTRVFLMRLRMGGLPVTGKDIYVDGKGTMRAKLLSLIPVVNESGRELDIGELVTYLNDMVLFMPSALLASDVTWREIDRHSCEITLRDGDLEVSATLVVNEDGSFKNFITTDRFYTNPDKNGEKFIRTRWSTPMSEYAEVAGRRIPSRGKAVWHLPEGDFEYADFTVQDIQWNVTAP